jgi:hypothetical protein
MEENEYENVPIHDEWGKYILDYLKDRGVQVDVEPAPANRTITGADIRAALNEAVAAGVIHAVNGIEFDADATVETIYRKHFGKA